MVEESRGGGEVGGVPGRTCGRVEAFGIFLLDEARSETAFAEPLRGDDVVQEADIVRYAAPAERAARGAHALHRIAQVGDGRAQTIAKPPCSARACQYMLHSGV